MEFPGLKNGWSDFWRWLRAPVRVKRPGRLPPGQERFVRRRALKLCAEGYHRQVQGDVKGAVSLYIRSIALWPTAEAHTYLGWAYSYDSRFTDAIMECRKAVALDPDFGNPYNDIGSYLIQIGCLDESIEWLERAKKATRYSTPHYPWMNLGRVYAAKGWLIRALHEFEGALRIRPAEPHCEAAAAQLREAIREEAIEAGGAETRTGRVSVKHSVKQ